MRFIAFLCLLFFTLFARADDEQDWSRQSLKGLKRVAVSVERASDEDYGFLSDYDLRTAVETKLRIAKILISDEPRNVLKEDGAFLCVQLTVVRPEEETLAVYAFHLKLQVQQPVKLMRNPAIILPLSVTWSTEVTGLLGKRTMRTVRNQLDDLTDRFINAYLSENPR